jgi:acyl-CoA oxidase
MPPIESREDAAACFERLIAEKLIRARDLDTQPFRFFLCHELVGVHDLSLLFLMSAHFNLYAGTLMRLGSEKHREASRKADEGQVGCFALTEGCHGVTSGLWLDTVARYDHERQCFVLSTPTPEAQKIWITNAGYFAENAVVMARLLVGSEDHGLHAFLVPLRPRRGAPTFAGISTQDVGQKTCLTNADMANITFDQVMVPREGLLDRHTRVDAQGNVDSELAGLAAHERFERIANQLLSGRLCVAGASLALAEDALFETVSHARTRSHQTGHDRRLPLFRHASYRHELIALLAEAYVRRVFTSAVQRAYAASTSKTEPDLVRSICAAKATNSVFAREVLATCQERLGNDGLLVSGGVGLAYNASYAAMLIEGDSQILLHKIARDALWGLSEQGMRKALLQTGSTVVPGFGVRRRAALGKLLARRQLFQGLFLASKMRDRHGAEAARAWFESLEDEALGYGRAVCDHLIWKSFAARAAGRDLGVDRLFALRCIQRDASGFARYAGVRSRQLVGVERAIRRLCDDLEPQLEQLLPTSARATKAVMRDA